MVEFVVVQAVMVQAADLYGLDQGEEGAALVDHQVLDVGASHLAFEGVVHEAAEVHLAS